MTAAAWSLSACHVVGAMCPLRLDADFSSARAVFTRIDDPDELLIHRGTAADGQLRGERLTPDEWAGLLASEEALSLTPARVDRPVVVWVFRGPPDDPPWWTTQVAALEGLGALRHSEERPELPATICLVDPRLAGDHRDRWSSELRERAAVALRSAAAGGLAQALQLARRAFCLAPRLAVDTVATLAAAFRLTGSTPEVEGLLSMVLKTKGEPFHREVRAFEEQLQAQRRSHASSSSSLEARQIRERIRHELFGRSRDLGRYQIRDKLGSGGMGVVYRAYDPLLDCDVALKQLPSHLAAAPALSERLRHEAKMMAKLRGKPHIVTLYDFFADHETVFVVMELVEGPNLRTWQTRVGRTWQEILTIYQQAGDGLRRAHEAGLVHHDFKPENVLVADGEARVADFGLARLSTPPAGASGAAAPLAGTLYYMAPERIKGAPDGPASDQYSFCVALYEALYDQHPMLAADSRLHTQPRAGTRRNDVATDDPFAEAILRGQVQPPPAGARRVPNHVYAALKRGMASAPGERHPSMTALLAALSARPVRRTALLASSGLGLALSAVAVMSRPSPATLEDRVAEARQEIDGALDLAGLRRQLPGEAAAPILDALGGHASQWADLAGTQRFAAQQGAAEAEARVECLERARDRFVDLADTLRGATTTTPIAIAALVEELPEPRACVELPLPYLRCRVDAAAQYFDRRADAVRAQMKAAEREALAGRYAGAIRHATTAADLIEALAGPAGAEGWKLLRSRAAVLRGRLHQLSEQPREALSALRDAYDPVESRECLDLRMEIASRTVKVVAQNPSVPDHVGADWLRTELNLAAAIPDGGLALATAHNDAGFFAWSRRHDPGYAIQELQYASALRRKVHGDRPTSEQADTLLNLGNAYLDSERVDIARKTLEQARDMRAAVLGADNPMLYRETASLGEADLADGNPTRALTRFEQAHALAVAGYGASSGPAAAMLLALANALADLDRGAEAAARASAAEIAARDAAMDPIVRVEIRAAAGVLLVGVGDAKAAVGALEGLAEEVSRSPELVAALPHVRLNLAEAVAHTEAYAAAEARASELIAWLDSPGAPRDPDSLLKALRLRGKMHYELDRMDAAIADYERMLEIPASSREHLEARILLGLALKFRDKGGDRSLACRIVQEIETEVVALPANDGLRTLFDAVREGCDM